MSHFYKRSIVLLIASILAPAAALGLTLDSGLDIWVTHGDGSTYISFEEDPLPADFFCSGSAVFDGRITLQGVPVATLPEGALGGADTLVRRLDDAVFDEDGVAVTRLQMQALHLEGVKPVKTWCGKYRIEVRLHGPQPVTEMKIYRESPNGGTFEAEVGVNGKLVFTPLTHKGEVLEVTRNVLFPAQRNAFWAYRPGDKGLRYEGFVVVDTDADGTPDTSLPGTSRNFAAGWPSTPKQAAILEEALRSRSDLAKLRDGGPGKNLIEEDCSAPNCHCDPGCSFHCLIPVFE